MWYTPAMLPWAQVLSKIAGAFALHVNVWLGIRTRGCRSYTRRPSRAAGFFLVVATFCFAQRAAQTLPTFSASTLPNGTIGHYYSQNVSIVGGRAPFTIVVTGVPGGLATTANGNPADTTGRPVQASAISLSGTPTQLGNNFPITVLVTDSSNPAQLNAVTYEVNILPSGTAATGIVADASQVGPAMTSTQLGANVNIGFPDSGNPAFLPVWSSAGVGLMRYPGGSLGDYFHWETDSLSSVSDACSLYRGNLPPATGFDPWMKATAIPLNSDVAITANYGSNATCTGPGDPNEAAAWVNYANNIQHYGVRYWTVGNEQYFPGSLDLNTVPNDPATYADRVSTLFYPLMKAQDPAILVGVDMFFGSTYSASADTWDQIVLANAKYDFVEMHYYPEGDGDYADDTQLLTTWSNQLGANFSTAKALLAANGHPDVPIFLGEFDRDPGQPYSNWPGHESVSIVNGLFNAIVVAEVTKAGVPLATQWDGVDWCVPETPPVTTAYGWQNYGSYGLFAGTLAGANSCGAQGAPAGTLFPKGRAYQILSQYVLAGEHTIAVASMDSSIRAYAATNRGAYALLLINTDSTSTHTLPITIDNASASSYTATTLTYGKQQYDQSAQGVWAGPVSTNLGFVGATFNVSLPAWSITLVRLSSITALAPVISSSNPSPTLGAVGGSSLQFSVNASDPDGNSLTYTWSVNGNVVASVFGPTYSLQLPLTANGVYKVTVVVSDGSRITETSWTVNVAAFRAPRFLFDETHSELNTLNATRAQQLNSQNPAMALFSILGQALVPNYQVTDLLNGTAGSLTPQVLSGADVLVLAAPATPLTAAENQAITSFVQAGGRLIFLGQAGLGTSINTLIEPWGIQFNSTQIESPQGISGYPDIFNLSSFANNPAVGLNPSFQVNYGGSLIVTQGGVALGETSAAEWRSASGAATQQPGDPNGPFVMVAAAQLGKGRVFVVSDNYFNDWILQSASFAGNLNLFLSGLAWVTGPVNSTPAAPPASTATVKSVVNAGSFAPSISPGSWASIFGSNLANTPPAGQSWTANDFQGSLLPTTLNGTSVLINGRPAAVSFVSPGQLNVQAPDDTTQGTVQVEVISPFGTALGTASLASVAPSIFPVVVGAVMYAAAVAVDGTLLAAPGQIPGARAANPGETVEVFGTGFGNTVPPQPAGRLVNVSPLANTVTASICGQPATVAYAGLVGPGLNQLNVVIPGSASGNCTVVLTVAGQSTQSGIALPVTK